MALNARKLRFVDEYIIDLNHTAAAIRAGYAAKTARTVGSKLALEPEVADAILAAMADRSARTHVTADRVVRELARIAFASIRDTVSWSPTGIVMLDSAAISDDAAAAIVEVSDTRTGRQRTIKIKLASKMAALALLAAHTGVGASAGKEVEDISADEDPPIEEEGG